jgi:hypothetical protein
MESESVNRWDTGYVNKDREDIILAYCDQYVIFDELIVHADLLPVRLIIGKFCARGPGIKVHSLETCHNKQVQISTPMEGRVAYVSTVSIVLKAFYSILPK